MDNLHESERTIDEMLTAAGCPLDKLRAEHGDEIILLKWSIADQPPRALAVCKPMNVAQYDLLVANAPKGARRAYSALLIETALWPAPEAMRAMLDKYPALSGSWGARLVQEVGLTEEALIKKP